MAMTQQERALQVDVRKTNLTSVYKLIDQHKGQIAAALPKHMNADRMARIALTELRSNPKLQECEPLSFFAAIIKSSQLGLEIGLLGEAYLIPRKIKGRMEVCFQPGYKGLRKLAKNTGDVRSIIAHCVYANDYSEISLGTENILIHKPTMTGDRGELQWVYAIITYRDGSKDFVPMTKQEVEHIRDSYSENYKNWKREPYWKDGNPKDEPFWVTDEPEAWKKTAILRACKQVELSPELKQAIEYDMKAETMAPQALTEDVFDITPKDEDEEVQDKKDALKDKLKAKKAKQEEPPPEKVDEPILHNQKCPVGGKLSGDFPPVEFCQACEQAPGCPSWA